MRKIKLITVVIFMLAIVISVLTFSSLAQNIYNKPVSGDEVYELNRNFDFSSSYSRVLEYDSGNIFSMYYTKPTATKNGIVETELKSIESATCFHHVLSAIVGEDLEYRVVDSIDLNSYGIVNSGTLQCTSNITMRTDHFAEVWNSSYQILYDIWDVYNYASGYEVPTSNAAFNFRNVTQ